MQIREAAERVLFGTSLDEKLSPVDPAARDDRPGAAAATPAAPGRPRGLEIAPRRERGEGPRLTKIDDERERGVLLHFLANHELLAAELMALNLLKFPDAPTEYRAGVFRAMREEQAHTRMYLRRMRECGVEFGTLPLNGYFWRLIAGVGSPLDFVARLNLTFEQANLDFSKHYAGRFREAGDGATARVLEQIYLDEIGHVGHGLQWFRRWKSDRETDWQAFARALPFPMVPAKAKGLAPFNAEGRRLAGLDEDFIRRLEVCEGSRGRTPAAHWFNPNGEAYASGRKPELGKFERAMEADLELVMLAPCRRDDLLLVREPPRLEHLASLKAAGLELPEFATAAEIGSDRKLGGLRPWAWSPDACEALRPLAAQVSATSGEQRRVAVPAQWLSKATGPRLEQALGTCSGARVLRDRGEALSMADAGPTLFKAAFACAGRGHFAAPERGRGRDELGGWLDARLALDGFVVGEPLLNRVADFSAQYDLRDGSARLLGFCAVENDAAGRFRAVRAAPRWGRLLPVEVSEFLFRDAGVTACYRDRVAAALPGLLPGYNGAVGVDALVHRDVTGSLALRPVVEVNVRFTMGRIALELMRRLPSPQGGELRILRKAKWDGGGLALSDPLLAKEFIAVWNR